MGKNPDPSGFTAVIDLVGENSKQDKYQCDLIKDGGSLLIKLCRIRLNDHKEAA